jgi:hypothetical protein
MRMIWSSRFWRREDKKPLVSSVRRQTHCGLSSLAYLEPLVLQHALDGGILATGRQLGLEDDAERAIADDLALGVS